MFRFVINELRDSRMSRWQSPHPGDASRQSPWGLESIFGRAESRASAGTDGTPLNVLNLKVE
jgi:hypothetical protein